MAVPEEVDADELEDAVRSSSRSTGQPARPRSGRPSSRSGRFGWRELSEFSAIGERVDLAVALQGRALDGEVTCCDETFRRLRELHVVVRGDERTEILADLGTRAVFRCKVERLVDDLATQALHRAPG